MSPVLKFQYLASSTLTQTRAFISFLCSEAVQEIKNNLCEEKRTLCRNISVSIYENLYIKKFLVKVSNIIVSIFKMQWRGGRSPARGRTQGRDAIFWEYFRYYCPPVCYGRCCHGAPGSTARCWCPLCLCVSASPATRIPLALKGEEIPTTRFPPWPRTAGVKGSGFPSPHMNASIPRVTAGTRPTAGGSSAPSPAPQPSPSEYGAKG